MTEPQLSLSLRDTSLVQLREEGFDGLKFGQDSVVGLVGGAGGNHLEGDHGPGDKATGNEENVLEHLKVPLGVKRALRELREARDRGVLPAEVVHALECFIYDHSPPTPPPEPSLLEVLTSACEAWHRTQMEKGVAQPPPLVPPGLEEE